MLIGEKVWGEMYIIHRVFEGSDCSIGRGSHMSSVCRGLGESA